MVVLGIDPAIKNTGWCIVQRNQDRSISYIKSGVIVTNSQDPLVLRLGLILSEIENIIVTYDPSVVGMEEIFINKNAISSIKLIHARGVIMGILGKYKKTVFEFAPNKIKKTITGNGHASKEQVIKIAGMMINNLNGIKSDEADAFAIAYITSLL